MYCCSNCFKDFEVKSIIQNISTVTGKCDLCLSESIDIVDVRELAEPFQSIVNLYSVDDDSSAILAELIQSEWNIFNLETDLIDKLLNQMFHNMSIKKTGLFTKKVSNKFDTNIESSNQLSQWVEFKEEIKTKNRFFIENLMELDLLSDLIKDQVHIYNSGKLFYRGRITKENGISETEIGKPPALLASAGRANPKGIPYLYVATDERTTLYETRATYLDYVTIGTFKSREKLKIVRLRGIGNKSPFPIENLETYVFYKSFLLELEKELSKPLRRYDSELDYLPSQYLCEFIKSKGYDGVEYSSSLNKGGINLAIFNDTKLEFAEKKVVEIKNINIQFE